MTNFATFGAISTTSHSKIPHTLPTASPPVLHGALQISEHVTFFARAAANILFCAGRLAGSTTFTANRGFRGGAIYNSAGNEEAGTPAAVTTFPADTVFVDNQADVSMIAVPLVSVVHVHEYQNQSQVALILKRWCPSALAGDGLGGTHRAYVEQSRE